MTTISLTIKNSDLWQHYQDKKAQDRMLFPTEGARALGVSELELMLAAPFSDYMGSDCKVVLKQFESFGRLESIVRNDLAVHEKLGEYKNLKLGDKVGIALNVGGLDLRFFMSQWHHMLAVSDTSNPDKPSYSIQFYDGSGNSINKVYLRDITEERLGRWNTVIEQQKQAWQKSQNRQSSEAQSVASTANTIELKPLIEKKSWQYKALNDEDLNTLQSEWQNITDVHQFHFLLEKLDIDRASSFRQAPEGMACELEVSAVETLLEQVRDNGCPIMIFVGNTGVVQIQTGQVFKLKRMGDWINILDKEDTDFTLHLKDRELAQVWCVKRPTKDGVVTCIEGFDASGTSVLTIFGQRLEGQPELREWQVTTDELMQTCKYAA